MHIVKDSEELFDKFTAMGLNAKQLMQDASTIVQNEGVELSDEDILRWHRDQMIKITDMHQEMLNLIRDVGNALYKM